jgi:hypothetical protein
MKFVTLRTERNHVMTRSTPTLTQSGLLAVLLQRQHYKVIQLARRRAQRKHTRASCGVTSVGCWPTLTAPSLVDDSAQALEEPFRGTLNLSPKPFAMSPQIHTYTELRQQIHDDLRILMGILTGPYPFFVSSIIYSAVDIR